MKSILPPLIVGLILSIVWGYFSDLRQGETKAFIIRLIIVPFILILLSKTREAKKSKYF
ncbi:hypothetical protein NST12_03890 [Bacillus sp. FSL W8-1127]|uniref:hypothetical protein n=1 Tax=Bacillus sp. FSL W8-1127 TaxID=2954710 RepID=UPI0030F982C9